MGLPTLSVTDWIAAAVLVVFIVYNFGSPVVGWVESVWGSITHKPAPAIDPSVELKNKFNLWCEMRSLPDLTPDAVKYLELLKIELLKWDN